MFNLLHSYSPDPIVFTIGSLSVHWYGVIMLVAIVVGLIVVLKLAPQFGIKKDDIWDLSFWIVLGAIIGARIYEVFLFFDYYQEFPADIIKVWQGGLAIHGAWMGGLIVAWIFAKQKNIPLLKILDLLTFGLIIGQAIGRWGNYFNQELYGLPTNKPWGIPIEYGLRPVEYRYDSYFHPTFLYESLFNLIAFGLLFIIKKIKQYDGLLIFSYLIIYSIIRFSLEYIRLDDTPLLIGLRWPQIFSLIIILISVVGIIYIIKKTDKVTKT